MKLVRRFRGVLFIFGKMTKLRDTWRNTLGFISASGPRLAATATFLCSGLSVGYIFAALRTSDSVLQYGPLFLGLLCAALCATTLLITKFIYGHYVFWHFDILIVGAFFNILGGVFFFINDYDIIGAFSVFIATGLTFIASLSYIHISSSKETRAIYLSACFVWYLLGIATSVSVIPTAFTPPLATTSTSTDSNIYLDFAFVFMPCTIVISVILVFIRVLQVMGTVEYKIMVDEELRIANLNNKIFESRKEVVTRVRDTKSFFYVTKNKQWLVSFILLFSEAIYASLFTYFIFWFSLNPAVKLTNDTTFDQIMWAVLLGAIIGTILLVFFTTKVIFVSSACAQIVLAAIGMILAGTIGNLLPFWIVTLLFGVMFACIKIAIVETSHFRFTEILLFIAYTVQLLPIGVINVYFVSDPHNLFFYSSDRSTLVAHGFTFLIIISMLSIIVGLQVPRLFKASLNEIQYKILGIIFQEHNIEQLNLGYLQAGKIPTNVENCESIGTP